MPNLGPQMIPVHPNHCKNPCIPQPRAACRANLLPFRRDTPLLSALATTTYQKCPLGYTIDAADVYVLDALNAERITHLAEKHQLTVQEIKAGIRRGNVISADDHEITDLRIYGDLAEYHYDLCGKEVYFRPLDGWWPESVKQAAEFKRLTARDVLTERA